MTKVKLNIAPRIVPNIAGLYSEAWRSIMEFLDNSIDAEELPNFYTASTGLPIIDSYPYQVLIRIEISGNSHLDGKIKIIDNCTGISKLENIIKNLGNSSKRNSSFTNGQFGYGMYSFLAICHKMEILSKHFDNSYSEYVEIDSFKFDEDDISKVQFDVKIVKNNFPFPSGTIVTLSNFHKNEWKQLTAEKLQTEIERHFELILNRKNIEISVQDNKGALHICKPFNYDDYRDTNL